MASVVSLGQTHENRSLTALRLSLGGRQAGAAPVSRWRWPWSRRGGQQQAQEDGRKLGLVIAAEAHAREWISTASSLYFAETVLSLADEYSRASSASVSHEGSLRALQNWRSGSSKGRAVRHSRKRKGGKKKKHGGKGKKGRKQHAAPLSPQGAHDLLAHFDVTVVPLSNPDGYAHTWKPVAEGGSRMWRKNRQAVEGQEDEDCIGIDVNRNWVSAGKRGQGSCRWS